jgi:hypothetical protein
MWASLAAFLAAKSPDWKSIGRFDPPLPVTADFLFI